MQPDLDRRRAALVLDKIDEILAWEKSKDQARNVGLSSLDSFFARFGLANAGGSRTLHLSMSFWKTFPGIEAEGLLPDGHSRESDEDSQAAPARNRVA